jgi:hypothetical protein
MSNGYEGRQPERWEFLLCGVVELCYLSIWLVVDPALDLESGRDRIHLMTICR